VLSREEYISKIKALQVHILRGDCYEINFCQEFFAAGAELEPFAVFEQLMALSPNPFSALYRLNERFLLCASPERFLARKGARVISQPIKGTIQRHLTDKAADDALKDSLRQSAKEQAENVMVVDLVRNDLTRICKPATVSVDELFGIYSFPQVHQMISTVSGELREDVSFSQIIEATFPMGSMTGAPKYRVMQLIDAYEPSARGIFSGSVGYKRPGGDFDFNVVIRSIMYNQSTAALSYQVGSGITFYSDAEREWEECMLKAEAIRKVLSTSGGSQ
jgi:para-aminobenzoate synthetase component 1